jgi:hypothetical protein
MIDTIYCSALDKTNTMSSVLGIHRYVDTFCLVGGVNAPKKVGCIGTDGKERPQLVKVEYLLLFVQGKVCVFMYG